MASQQFRKAKPKDCVHRSSRTLSGDYEVGAQHDHGAIPADGFRAAFNVPSTAADSRVPAKVSVDPSDRSDRAADGTIQPLIQAKRVVGAPGNHYEREADRVAARVVNQVHAAISEKSATAGPDVGTTPGSADGGAVQLPANIKEAMEQALGTNFGEVTIHADRHADRLNRSLRSRAFTAGHDVFFRQGEYDPHSRTGQELLAHELTHVVQHNGLVQRKLEIGPPDAAVTYADADAVREAAFEEAGATALSIESLALQAEAEGLYSYAGWQDAFTDAEEEPLPETAPNRTPYVPAVRETPKIRTERRTRLGFEIEPGSGLTVKLAFVKAAKQLVNVTLAETKYLEFVIDDVKDNGAVQVEFRTKPLTPAQLKTLKTIANEIRASIIQFPLFSLTQGLSKAKTTLEEQRWTVTDAFKQLVPQVTESRSGQLPKRLAQHVTHSIPLAGFAKLTEQERNFLIPGSGGADSVSKLIIFFFGLQLRKLDAANKTILISTTGRNSNRFNVKTAIDTLIGLLPPEKADRVVSAISKQLPTRVKIESEKPIPIGDPEKSRPARGATEQSPALEAMEQLPQGGFPRFNTGFISGEEKLQPPLFDDLRKDIRVLVEHRTDELVDAVNKAATSGDGTALAPYLEIFAKLDKVKGDDTFKRWFQ